MYIEEKVQLTYCTNIHAGESWAEVFESLKNYALPLKQKLSPNKPFGIGLRLSDLAAQQLLDHNNLYHFKVWLQSNGLYVFTMNGFPYGGFHGMTVKDDVHKPDWTTRERVDYTMRLCRILHELLPFEGEGGISTSPISYKYWFKHEAEREAALQKGAEHLTEVLTVLFAIYVETGKVIHLDIEPEPDGLIENEQEFIAFMDRLRPMAIKHLMAMLDIPQSLAEEAVQTHVRLCYDVCHFAVLYKQPVEVLYKVQEAGWKIGKVQLSAALKADLPTDVNERDEIKQSFSSLAESTYLHQVAAKMQDGTVARYADLPDALPNLNEPQAVEWRTHFHVPLFVSGYGLLKATQQDIVDVLHLQKTAPFTNHFEVETYTWQVLPAELKLDLAASIQREMEWVMAIMKG